jgi:hypothetical protein
MLTRRFFQILFVFAVLCVIPVALAFAAHGGGGGGGGGHAGGGAARAGGGTARSAYSYSGANYSRQSSYHANGAANWAYHNWNYYPHGYYWGGGWGGWGYWNPFWFSFWGGYPYGWGGYWPDYFYPYGPVYASQNPMAAYVYPYSDEGQYAANYAPAPVVAPENTQPVAEGGEGEAAEGLQYYNDARAAFAQGDYRNAIRLGRHAGVEIPQNPQVYELTSLALFALGDYRDAAMEAHAALALGAPSDWPHLYAYYKDGDRYTGHLRALEKAVGDAPSSAPGQFLLGYHYLMTGAKGEAKAHFTQAAKLTPNDKLAEHILKQLEAGGPVTPPKLPTPPSGEPKGKLL